LMRSLPQGTSTPLAQLARATVPLLEQQRPLASCANGVLVPWGNDRIKDENFPSKGPVHTEFPKSLVGLSGESRSHDPNGPWFKVLGSGGIDTVTSLGPGLFGVAGSTIRGTNPPKMKRPPLRPDVPCETQQQPDLETIPGASPPTIGTRPGSKAAKARSAKARGVAIEIMQRKLDRQMGSKAPKVLDRDATAADLKLSRGIGR